MTGTSWRPRPMLLAVLAAFALAVTGCGGGGDGDKNGSAGAGQEGQGGQGGAYSSDGSPAPKEGAPLPKVQPVQVRPLVGRWVGAGPTKDYFVFRADGSGAWMARGRALWKGQVIPDGANKFRFSWEGRDPQQASYWGVTLESGGRKLVFGGTNQTYTKVAS
ncbi:hypothetical protein [Thermomonospora echinospora]|uniref:hypothetical protein n=1 Tax=Thermomonospora echinospora TaxID=1992 RepID=UPI001F292690|nr:hypothetical protein [Thermomonospora echinospora]